MRTFMRMGLTIAAWVASCGAANSSPDNFASAFSVEAHNKEQIWALPSASLDIWELKRASPTVGRLRIVVAYFRQEEVHVTIKPVDRSGSSSSLFNKTLCSDNAIAINGGFYLNDNLGKRPLGLVRVDGATLSQPSGRKFGGFLVLNGDKIQVLARSARNEALRSKYALESSPVIVEAGQVGIRSDNGERFDRMAIGTSKDNGVLAIGAFGEGQDTMTLTEFARTALEAADRAGHPANDLIAMDGGPSAHLYVGSKATLYGYRGPTYLPNVVCLAQRHG